MAKFFALALLSVYFTVFAAVSAEEGENECIYKKMIQPSIDACRNKISDENLEKLKKNEEETNEEINAYELCIAKHAGFFKDGNFDVPAINAKIDETISDPAKAQAAKAMVENCAKSAEGAETDIEKVASYSKCFIEAKKAFKAQKQQ